MPLPGGGPLSGIPGDGDLLALTLDDGVNTDVVRRYTQFAKDTGVRLTYLVNGTYKSWTEHRDLPRPPVEAAQIRLGNHTVASRLSHIAQRPSGGTTSAHPPTPDAILGRHDLAAEAVAAELG